MSFQFFDKLYGNLKEVETKEKENINKAVELFDSTIRSGNSIYIFGASHAGLVSQEMFYRAGGFMLINPILPRELSLDNDPITVTSQMERLEGYGNIISKKVDLKENDLLIIHSVSGRNSVAIDMALEASKKNVKVIAITNLEYSKSVTSRHSSGKKLYELADLVIDNHGPIGDAICTFDNSEQRIGATSNIVATAILNSVVVELAEKMLEEGVEELPFFYSANLDGGDEKNLELYNKFRDQIHYKL